MRLLNLVLFSLFIAVIISLPIIFVDRYLPQSQSPWQLQPFGCDSLSESYKSRYQIIGDTALINFIDDSARTIVNILIDGRGVPYDEDMLMEDFGLFKESSPKLAIHKRTLNYTAIIERNELQERFTEGAFLFNGDYATCIKRLSNLKRYFSRTDCFEKYEDVKMVPILDSLLADGSMKRIAWTSYETREGDRKKLHQVLNDLSKLAKKYPQVQFIIQGTHRPILGTPETRRKYLAPWVPAIFANTKTIR